MTKPPSELSESDLLGLMEHHGIGTDASMASHINNICERGYVSIQAQRRLVPTSLGLSLARGYAEVDPDLMAPELRGNIEKKVNEIAKVT